MATQTVPETRVHLAPSIRLDCLRTEKGLLRSAAAHSSSALTAGARRCSVAACIVASSAALVCGVFRALASSVPLLSRWSRLPSPLLFRLQTLAGACPFKSPSARATRVTTQAAPTADTTQKHSTQETRAEHTAARNTRAAHRRAEHEQAPVRCRAADRAA